MKNSWKPPVNVFFKNIGYTVFAMHYLSALVYAQMLDSNQPPPGIHWRQLQTQHYAVIFPAEIESEAQRVANTLEYLHQPLRKTLRVESRRWPLVLSNRSTVANGYVSLAPRKSEWFATPPQENFSGTEEWYNLLAVHEGRHMAQFDYHERGFTRLTSFLFGDVGRLLSFWQTPAWYWEGDAVGIETALSRSGRGRIPEFDIGVRALELSGFRYSYYKAFLNSYRDYYPNHYTLGYLMTTHVRRRYGADAWARIITRSAQRSYSPFAFSRMAKRIIGKNSRQIYQATMNELDSLWQWQSANLTFEEVAPLNKKPKKVWTQYRWPQWSADGSLWVTISGMADIPTLVRIQADGREKPLTFVSGPGRVAINGQLATWSVYNTDRFWGSQIASDVAVCDLQTGRVQEITSGGRYFAPAPAPDGKVIAAIEFTPERRCAIVLLDPRTGATIRRFPAPANSFLREPSWSQDGKFLIMTRQQFNGKTLTMLDCHSGEFRDLLPESDENVSNPIQAGDYIFYSSSYSGIDNIYALDLMNGRRYQVISSRFGAFSPMVKGNQLVYSDYAVKGLDIKCTTLDTVNWRALETIVRRPIDYFAPIIEQENPENPLMPEKIPNIIYPSTEYSPRVHLINIHSWYFIPVSGFLAAGCFSTDLLNTFQFNPALLYYASEKALFVNATCSYAGIRPIVDVSSGFGRRFALINNGRRTVTDVWTESNLALNLRLPYDLSSGVYSQRLELSAGFGITSLKGKEQPKSYANNDGSFCPFYYRIAYQKYRSKALRDLRPVAGLDGQLTLRHTPFKMDYQGRQLVGEGNLYFPGIARHHSLVIGGAVEIQDPTNYRFVSPVSFVRGYAYTYYDHFRRASLDYAFPLFYPDFALGALFNCKRIWSNLFGDRASGKTGSQPVLYDAVGIELQCDFNLFTMPVDLTGGVRYTYRLHERDTRMELVFAGIAL